MSLPTLTEVGLTWAQLVALSPILTIFEQPEVEIENDETIPDYDGPVGFLGQSLSLALVAVGGVKLIFAINEALSEDRRKRRRLAQHHEAYFYFKMAALLDHQQCVHQFLCLLAVQAHKRKVQTLIGPFWSPASIPQLNEFSASLDDLEKAYRTGLASNSSDAACVQSYSRCRNPMALLCRALIRTHDFVITNLPTTTAFFQQTAESLKRRRKKTWRTED